MGRMLQSGLSPRDSSLDEQNHCFGARGHSATSCGAMWECLRQLLEDVKKMRTEASPPFHRRHAEVFAAGEVDKHGP